MTFGFGHGFTRGVGAAGGPIFSLGFTGPNFPANVTFSRGTAATLMGQNRLIQYAPMNLVPRSQSGFGNNPGWLFNGPTAVSTNNTAPDSTATAIKIGLQSTAINSSVQVLPQPTLTVGATYTFSMYAKAAEYSLFNLGVQASVAGCQFNLLTGTAGTPGSDAATTVSNPTITNVGNGWYRCSITVVRPTTAGTSLLFTPSNVAWASGNIDQIVTGAAGGASGIYVWGGQLENGGTVGAYAVTTGTAYYGPRQDYDPTTLVAQNLFTFSNDFTSPALWGNGGFSVTPNATADPFGGTAASQIMSVSGADVTVRAFTATCLPATVSIYVRPSANYGLSNINLQFRNNTTSTTLVNCLASATSGSTANGSYLVSDAGNGWKRVSMTATSGITMGDSLSFYYGATFAVTPGFYWYVYGGQWNDYASALTYTATTTAAITQCAPLGLLVEEARTNLCLYSQDLTQATVWSVTNCTITANATVSPSGISDASALVENASASAAHEAHQAVSKAASAITYTYSLYVKAAGRSWICATLYDGSANGYRFWFNVSTGVLGSSAIIGAGFTGPSYSMVYVGNGWYQCVCTVTSNAATAIQVFNYSTDADLSTAPATGLNAAGLYIWGVQLEAGAFATSYIPTAAAAVPRNADNATITPGAWYNQPSGTIVAVADTANIPGPSSLWDTSTATAPGVFGSTTVNYGLNGSFSQSVTGALTKNVSFKTAYAYLAGNHNGCTNGGTVANNVNAAVIASPASIGIGSRSGTVNFLNGHIQSLAYYNTALSNTQLQLLTKISSLVIDALGNFVVSDAGDSVVNYL